MTARTRHRRTAEMKATPLLRRMALCAAAAFALAPPATAQEGTGRVTVEVRAGAAPVAEATVRSGAVAGRTGGTAAPCWRSPPARAR